MVTVYGVPYAGTANLSINNGGGTATCSFTGAASASCTPATVGSANGTKTATTVKLLLLI